MGLLFQLPSVKILGIEVLDIMSINGIPGIIHDLRTSAEDGILKTLH
jgi:hypothetical protein